MYPTLASSLSFAKSLWLPARGESIKENGVCVCVSPPAEENQHISTVCTTPQLKLATKVHLSPQRCVCVLHAEGWKAFTKGWSGYRKMFDFIIIDHPLSQIEHRACLYGTVLYESLSEETVDLCAGVCVCAFLCFRTRDFTVNRITQSKTPPPPHVSKKML